ncbi:uncharacterized protein BYT42DRAFT_574282 [Radiomyces spectabilis]|uniref:uncharacterized protein n=1 Tax=Radiomyces spectabilis TaxID=64574 RepID=UPI00222042B6|nr:uncharacterized protein BYT42DRAFT_574282 [Radiomyces spectabilis]KAI8376347.1 hypothetical protein BYT42DRAFT_574282 [Radiomyces spectabilis]
MLHHSNSHCVLTVITVKEQPILILFFLFGFKGGDVIWIPSVHYLLLVTWAMSLFPVPQAAIFNPQVGHKLLLIALFQMLLKRRSSPGFHKFFLFYECYKNKVKTQHDNS